MTTPRRDITTETQSRVTEQMASNLEQARKAWLNDETQGETIRRVARQCLMLRDGRYREDAS